MQPVFCLFDYKCQLRENPLKLPKLFFRDLKFCWQRCRRGYCDKDLWNIDHWFLNMIPDMLTQFKETRHGSPGRLGEDYVDEKGILCNDSCHDRWTKILEEMIFLFQEANEETCQKKNSFEEEHDRICDEFTEKYGLFGEKLEKESPIKIGNRRIHFAKELPEYQKVEEQYFEEEKKLYEYRNDCKNQALELFSEWFWDLWD